MSLCACTRRSDSMLYAQEFLHFIFVCNSGTHTHYDTRAYLYHADASARRRGAIRGVVVEIDFSQPSRTAVAIWSGEFIYMDYHREEEEVFLSCHEYQKFCNEPWNQAARSVWCLGNNKTGDAQYAIQFYTSLVVHARPTLLLSAITQIKMDKCKALLLTKPLNQHTNHLTHTVCVRFEISVLFIFKMEMILKIYFGFFSRSVR